jgi:hypothetical protein
MAARRVANVGKAAGTEAPVAPRVLARLFRDPDLHLLLAHPRSLAYRLREEGCELPAPVPALVRVDPGISRELWPTDGALPPWLPGFLDTNTHAVVRQVIAHLVAARPEPTPCWAGGVPTPRIQSARASALLRVAAQLMVGEEDSSQTPAWWTVGWQAPAAPHERADLYDRFMRAVRRELHEGPSRSQAKPPAPVEPEEQLEDRPVAQEQAKRQARRRLGKHKRPSDASKTRRRC